MLIWDTAALRGTHQAPVSCWVCCWSQMWPEIVPAWCSSGKDEQTLHPCGSEMMGWGKCPDVTWQICGSCLLNPRWTHGYFLSRHLACQVMWMSCGLMFICHCAQSPAVFLLTAYSIQARPPACAPSLSKVPDQLWEEKSWPNSWGAMFLVIFVLRCVNSILENNKLPKMFRWVMCWWSLQCWWLVC